MNNKNKQEDLEWQKAMNSFGSGVRQNFPFFDQTQVYLDSAATTQKPLSVIQAQSEFLSKYNSNIHRSSGSESTNLIESVRAETADRLGVDTEEVFFCSGFSEGLCSIAWGIYFGDILDESSLILITEFEHHSNILVWQKIAKLKNCKLEYIRVHKDHQNQSQIFERVEPKDDREENLEYDINQNLAGTVDWMGFEALLKKHKKNIKVFSISEASNITGYQPPIEKMIARIREFSADCICIVDGSQGSKGGI